MFIFDWKSRQDDPEFDAMLARLKSLVADMEAVGQGRAGGCLLDGVPFLDCFQLAQRPSVCLIGQSSGHPLLPGADRQIVTSELYLLSADRQWARTLSRWYRLGTPLEEERTSPWYR